MRGLAPVAFAVLVFSTTAVLVRWAAPLSAYELTFGRMAVAAVAVGVVAAARGELRGQRPPVGRFAVYGLIAALHFLTFIASLRYTTVAHSLSLVYTAPIFVTLGSTLLLGEPLHPRKLLGLPVTAVGIAILTGFEPMMTPEMALGDGLAVASAVCFGFYSVAGRRERAAYPLLTYAALVYGSAAIWLAPVALLAGNGALSPLAVVMVIALGLGPLAIGHTLYNASLRRAHPTFVNLISTQEVTGSILLAFLLLNETPAPTTLAGAAISILGVLLVMLL